MAIFILFQKIRFSFGLVVSDPIRMASETIPLIQDLEPRLSNLKHFSRSKKYDIIYKEQKALDQFAPKALKKIRCSPKSLKLSKRASIEIEVNNYSPCSALDGGSLFIQLNHLLFL